MLTIYKTINKQLATIDKISKGCWINIVNPDEEEINYVSQELGIEKEEIISVLDAEEPSRLEKLDHYSLLIVDLPIVVKKNNTESYTTIPIAIFIKETLIVTVCISENEVIKQFIENKVKNVDTTQPMKFVLQILSKNIHYFLLFLRQIDKISDLFEEELQKSAKNKDLIKMLYLQKSLVYFSNSLSTNQIVLDKLHRYEEIKYSLEEKELLEYLLIENRQAIEMTKTYSEILGGLMDFFASVISNNLNVVMKILTSITLIFYIPTLIASLFGMNVPLPLEKNPLALLIIIVLSFSIATLVAIFLKRKDLL